VTSRADLPRLGASCGVLGTLIEMKGQDAFDITGGWVPGPGSSPKPGTRGGGGADGDPEREDERKRRAHAAKVHADLNEFHRDLDRVVQRGLRLYDVAFPGHPAELRNKRTNDLDPVTSADVAAAGWCRSCWRNDQQMVPIEVNKRTSLRYYRDFCRFCGAFVGQHKIEPPLPILVKRHAGRRITEADIAEALKDTKPLSKKQQRKARKNSKKAA